MDTLLKSCGIADLIASSNGRDLVISKIIKDNEYYHR